MRCKFLKDVARLNRWSRLQSVIPWQPQTKVCATSVNPVASSTAVRQARGHEDEKLTGPRPRRY
ncbi:MAG: hypothetical protein QOF62_445 [Pyrinomonadaceae bacterium]|jgi:hypothetical protein|nr:hypothetical protein [Pyrinomonadaceae bacterium]